MTIAIKIEPPQPYNLGGASFISQAAGATRLFAAAAEKARDFDHLDLTITSSTRIAAYLSVDEAEALIACLRHAIEVRRAFEAGGVAAA